MSAGAVEIAHELSCDGCGYDLRAQPEDGRCPECGMSVAESRRLAAVPRRPAWGKSDPRWRRRVLAGTWLLVFLPLMSVLRAFDWASRVPVPEVFDSRGTVRTLDDTMLAFPGVFEPLVFCTGVALLFSKERGRRAGRLDWTRRWGVVCGYVVLLLSAVQVLFITALVSAGIAALFLSMPPKYQPGATQWFIDVSAAYLRYGPYPKDASVVVLVASSAIAMLLACVAVFDALRSSGPRSLAMVLLAPLVLFAALQLAQVGRYCFGDSGVDPQYLYSFAFYFRPQLLAREVAGVWSYPMGYDPLVRPIEFTKWGVVVVIAVWLSGGRIAAWWRGEQVGGSLRSSDRGKASGGPG